jgi:hypothetical protein
MNDLTLVYYTANHIRGRVANNVRKHLLKTTENRFPIISVSQESIDFGENICVGKIGMSHYNCYWQIFMGVQDVRTKYMACCEDDVLYNMEHFSYRPPEGHIAYNRNVWYIQPDFYYKKDFMLMGCCVAETEVLLENLEARFKKYPDREKVPQEKGWQGKRFREPGSETDRLFGIEPCKYVLFETETPIGMFDYKGSLDGLRKSYGRAHPEYIYKYELDPFGDILELNKLFWKGTFGDT